MAAEHRIMRCPECGRVSSVAPWIARPICVHSWDAGIPEIWDGDETSSGGPIEFSRNEEWRTPGPKTWTEMVPVVIEGRA